MRVVNAAVILVTVLAGSARADSLIDMLGPRAIAVGEALRGAAVDSTAIALNPSGLPLSREVAFEGGYGYRLSDHASLFDASACDSTSAVPGCFYYDYNTSSPKIGGTTYHRHTHIAGTALAYPLTPRVFLGVGVKYFHFTSTVPNEADASGVNWDLGTTVRLTNVVNVGVVGYNLLGTKSVDFPRAIGGGILARLMPTLALSFDARWKLEGNDHSARFGGGAELFLRSKNGQTGIPIRMGVLHDSGLGATYISAGLGLAAMKYSIDVAARHSVAGPDETLFIASMRFYGPRLPAPALSAPASNQ